MDKPAILLLINDTNYANQLEEKLINTFAVSISRTVQKIVEINKILSEKQIIAIIAEHTGLPNILANIISEVKENSPEIPIAVISEDKRSTTREQFNQSGANRFLPKNQGTKELIKKLEGLINHTEKDSVEKKDWEIIGEGNAIKKVREEIAIFAPSDISLLIQGETGTGKELVARQIHLQSNRKDKPFIPLNMGGLIPQLADSELFGHEKGAFTGAIKERKGALELAGTGSVFFDEIDKTHADILHKLLRVLQEKEFTKLGSDVPTESSARFIFATNVDLKGMVENERFPKDVYYRLCTPTISLPSLRTIPEDIPLLADHFLKKYAQKYDKDISNIADKVIDVLVGYKWPGNIRELE